MPEQEEREKASIHPDLVEAHRAMQQALFGPPDEGSVFGAHPPDEPIRPGEETIGREQELREAVDKLFGLASEILEQEGEISPTYKAVTQNKERGTIFSRAAIESPKESGIPPKEVQQIWISEEVPMDAEPDTDIWERRPDVWVPARREEVLENFTRLAQRSPEQAAVQKEDAITELTTLAQIPIRTYNIQFQTVEPGSRHNPKVGIRIHEYLDGWQAFPVIYEGTSAHPLYASPLFEGPSPLVREDTGEKLTTPRVSDEEFQNSGLYRATQQILDRINF